MPPSEEIILSVENLHIHFLGDGPVSRAVEGIDYKIHGQETVCIVGESGCGKTVTALAIMGLLPQPPARVVDGRILFKGQSLLETAPLELQQLRGKKIAMVFQEPMTSLNPVFTIGDQISEAILAHETITDSEAKQRTVELLKDVGIHAPKKRIGDYPHQLSGGQRQRVMIAMALACEPDLIIADEPTTALDVTIQAQILALLKDLQQRKHMAIQYITHDLSVVAVIADHIHVMYAGIIVEQGTKHHIFQEAKHPYTRALLASLPTKDKRGQRLYSISGAVPHPAYKPTGCPFHPRCDLGQSSCQTEFPQLFDHGNGHLARCPITYETGNGN